MLEFATDFIDGTKVSMMPEHVMEAMVDERMFRRQGPIGAIMQMFADEGMKLDIIDLGHFSGGIDDLPSPEEIAQRIREQRERDKRGDNDAAE
jgi:hypothetical protein